MNFARTAYEPKREMGCHLVRLDHAVTHRNTFLHAILRRVMPAALNQAGQSPRTPDLAGHLTERYPEPELAFSVDFFQFLRWPERKR